MAIWTKSQKKPRESAPGIRIFMATKTKSNVRELEGGLVKLMAFSSLTGAPITMQMAQQVLKHLVHTQERRSPSIRFKKWLPKHFVLKQAQAREKQHQNFYPGK